MRFSLRARIVLVGAVLTAVIVFSWVGLTYNSLVARQTGVQVQWAQVENQYRGKIDLIPNLVATMDQYQQFESSTLQNITRLRSLWLNANGLEAQLNITNAIDQNLFRIMVTYETYPDLHSIAAVVSLMDELAGTENSIAVERMRFNDQVRGYNTLLRSFPSNLVAGWYGFGELGYYDPILGGP